MSPSSRGRGLKSFVTNAIYVAIGVALFTRAWIEIVGTGVVAASAMVALFTRAWIEIICRSKR